MYKCVCMDYICTHLCVYVCVCMYACTYVGCIQSLDWTGLDWTTGLPLKLKFSTTMAFWCLFIHIPM